jgi:hypothetical protein
MQEERRQDRDARGKCDRWDPDDWGRIPMGSKKEGKINSKNASGRMQEESMLGEGCIEEECERQGC